MFMCQSRCEGGHSSEAAHAKPIGPTRNDTLTADEHTDTHSTRTQQLNLERLPAASARSETHVRALTRIHTPMLMGSHGKK